MIFPYSMNPKIQIVALASVGTLVLSLAINFSLCHAGNMDAAKAAARVRDFSKAAELLEPLAKAGNTEAQYQLASLLRSGKGVPRDYEQAIKWLNRAAAQDNTNAQYTLGIMYENGWGVEKSQQEAMEWFSAAAARDHVMAKRKLDKAEKMQERLKTDPALIDKERLLRFSTIGDIEKVTAILKKGANVNVADEQGRTPLILASEQGHLDIVQSLLRAEADIHAIDKRGHNALLIATDNGHFPVVNWLLNANGNSNTQDKNGNTPLILATQKRDQKLVMALLTHGADVEIKNINDRSAIQIAKSKKYKSIFKSLYSAQKLQTAKAAVLAEDFPKAIQLIKPLAEESHLFPQAKN